jgi:hypothetical protein
LIGPSQKHYTLEAPQIKKFCIGGWSAFPLDEKYKNFGQNIWDKNLMTYWGTCWELGKPFGNRKN